MHTTKTVTTSDQKVDLQIDWIEKWKYSNGQLTVRQVCTHSLLDKALS